MLYKRTIRISKIQSQKKVQQWLLDNLIEKANVLTLAGPNPTNAINSVKLIANKISLSEIDKNNYAYALNELGNTLSVTRWAENNWSPYTFVSKDREIVFLKHEDIFNEIHSDCNCFYYDICGTHKKLNLKHIEKEIVSCKKKEISIIFTVSLRGKGCAGEDTNKIFIDFINKICKECNFSSLVMSPIGYKGGPNSNGTQMYIWAAILRKKEKMTKKKVTEIEFLKKQMIHVLVQAKDVDFINEDIAEAFGVSTQQVAAIDAWHSGKLANKLNNKKSR